MFSSILAKLSERLRRTLGLRQMMDHIKDIRDMAIDQYKTNLLLSNSKYKNVKNLVHFEYQVFSQFGEDGILAEILKRIGIKNHYFVEIGAEDGLENNTANLLLQNFNGLWIEANQKYINQMNQQLLTAKSMKNRLQIIGAFVTADNINSLLKNANVPEKFDVLSIDIDGNDYYIWQALAKYRPRVVVIEYNALLGPEANWVQPYVENFVNRGDAAFGASLLSLQKLANTLGYDLVSCNSAGVNAFFVRRDLVKNKFHTPLTAAHHFQPFRQFLYSRRGNPRSYDILIHT